jgi:hypothetical protein
MIDSIEKLLAFKCSCGCIHFSEFHEIYPEQLRHIKCMNCWKKHAVRTEIKNDKRDERILSESAARILKEFEKNGII